MRERINRLAKGIVDAEQLKILVTPETITETVHAGEVTRKELYVAEAQGRFIKGLVYSSNMRVRLVSDTFGGNRNRVSYEVDSRNLSGADVIEGAFYLVTNGGERKLPYSFSIDIGASGKMLAKLKTPADLAELARQDKDLALRLFEYRDFVEAPFMQDLHIRALYDGLKGGLNHQNRLEEFLVALGAKKPVSLEVDASPRRYDGVKEPVQAELEVRGSTWGYVRFDVAADGDFLELPKRAFGPDDFKDGICMVPYRVNPSHLHRGKNLGALIVSTIRETIAVPVEAQFDGEKPERSGHGRQKDLHEYLCLRLQYEMGIYEDRLLINQMKQVLERMRRASGEDIFLILSQAELFLLEGQRDRAAVLLEDHKPLTAELKEKNPDFYCMYQYLLMQLQKKEGQRENLLRVVGAFLSEKPDSIRLYLLRLALEPSIRENPSECLDEMRAMFEAGCRSPYLYAHAFKLYEKDPQLLAGLGSFERQVMMFAVKQDLIPLELALRVARFAAASRHYRALSLRILVALYEKYKDKELLSAVCCMMIKGDRRGEEAFPWYQKAIEAGVSLTRLYEYYLYSLPREYPYLLPKEVLLYFSYEKSLDDYSRSLLYMNIIKFMKPEAALYKQYERETTQFAMEQLLKSRINRRLVVLYRHMIYKEMIDEKVARVLPSILKSYRVRLNNPHIRSVVVCYEEMDGEDVYPVKDGVAYVPLFSGRPVLLFQDDYGNRYSNIPYRKQAAMEQENTGELEERCYEVYPGHPMLRLKECGEIVESGISGEADVLTLKRASQDLRLHPLFKHKILTRMIEYYRGRLKSEEDTGGDDVDYLMELSVDCLSHKERAGICETLIGQDYIREAYEVVKRYGYEGIPVSRLLKLCTRMILQKLFDEDDGLLHMAWRLFVEGKYDSVLLDYLCEHFNGSTDQMFRILNRSVREHIETYDMPERLLAQMMFTGETLHIDQVFDWYAAGKKTSDTVVKAYFTMKSADYFLWNMETSERVFAYLEGVMHSAPDKAKIPTIYMMALTKYYSTLDTLDGERKELCGRMVEQLLNEGRVFACFRDLARLMPMPESVTDKVIVEYRGGRDESPELMVRILPEDGEFSRAEMRKVYPGIFVHQKTLFEGEELEYRIYGREDGTRRLFQEGKLSCDSAATVHSDSRYAALNEMGRCLPHKKEDALKEKMERYLTDNAMMEELFTLM